MKKTSSKTSQENELEVEMDAYIQALTAQGKFSGSVLVALAGTVIHSAGYGLADREHNVPNTPQTKFRIGSITKQFTAMAIMILAEQEQLSVQDLIHLHLPYSPEHWTEITIHHLLNHTAGLKNLTEISGWKETTARMSLTLPEIIDTFRDIPLEFRPGSKHRYSNSGYILLGDIIERASGMTYEAFLRTHIFDPLGMADSGYDHNETILPHRANGYRKEDGEWKRAEYIDMGFPFAAGALYSTVEDLYNWDLALGADKLISPESYLRMTTMIPLLAPYGYGFQLGKAYQRKTVSHTGGINGFRAKFVRFPEESACVIVLTNFESSDFVGVSQTLSAILFGEPYTVPAVKTSIELDDDMLASYRGFYEIIPGVTLTVNTHANGLTATSGLVQRRFLPESETVFFSEDSTDTITFHRANEGTVSHLTLSQDDLEIEARKVSDA